MNITNPIIPSQFKYSDNIESANKKRNKYKENLIKNNDILKPENLRKLRLLCGCLEFSNSKMYFEGQRVSLKGTCNFSIERKELGSCHSVFKQE